MIYCSYWRTITWAAYAVGTQDLTREYGVLAVTSWTLWVGTAGLVALGGKSLWSMDLGAISPVGWFGVAYSGILAIAVALPCGFRFEPGVMTDFRKFVHDDPLIRDVRTDPETVVHAIQHILGRRE